MFTKTFRDKKNLRVERVAAQLGRLSGTSDLLVGNRALLGLKCPVSANNEHILPVVNCIVSESTHHKISGIVPFARFNVESTDCRLAQNGIRVSTKQVKRVADVDDRGVINILVDLYRGSSEKLEIKN